MKAERGCHEEWLQRASHKGPSQQLLDHSDSTSIYSESPPHGSVTGRERTKPASWKWRTTVPPDKRSMEGNDKELSRKEMSSSAHFWAPGCSGTAGVPVRASQQCLEHPLYPCHATVGPCMFLTSSSFLTPLVSLLLPGPRLARLLTWARGRHPVFVPHGFSLQGLIKSNWEMLSDKMRKACYRICWHGRKGSWRNHSSSGS